MRKLLTLGLAVCGLALFANVNTASADHCRSGGGFGYSNYGNYGYSNSYYRGGYSTYRYSYPRNRVYYNRGFHGRRGIGYSPYYRGSGIYYRGNNFGFGLRF